jgi:hypothetical protein
MIKKILELLSMEIARQLKSAERSKNLEKQHKLLRLSKGTESVIDYVKAGKL